MDHNELAVTYKSIKEHGKMLCVNSVTYYYWNGLNYQNGIDLTQVCSKIIKYHISVELHTIRGQVPSLNSDSAFVRACCAL